MLTLLLGPDSYAKSQRLRQLMPDQAVWIMAEDGLVAWYKHLGQADLFGQAAPLVGVGLLSLPATDKKALAELWQGQDVLRGDQQVFVVEEGSEVPKRDALATILLEANTEHFAWPSQGQVVQWLSQECQKLGVASEKPALVEMATRFGSNRWAMQSELEKLVTTGVALNLAAVERMVPVGQDGDVFGLMEVWAGRKTDTALDRLLVLWQQQQSAQSLIALFERQARLLYLVQLHQEFGTRGQELASTLGVPAFVVTKAQATAKKWQMGQLKQAITGLFELDVAIKTGKVEPQLGVELWMMESLG